MAENRLCLSIPSCSSKIGCHAEEKNWGKLISYRGWAK